MLWKTARIFSLFMFLSACSLLPGFNTSTGQSGYQMISAPDLHSLLLEEDLTLINVHIPLEGTIVGTDLTIPFDDVKSYKDQLPINLDEKIVIYCRSEGMGHTAAQTLVEMGYTDVWNLEDGYNAWNAYGYPFEE